MNACTNVHNQGRTSSRRRLEAVCFGDAPRGSTSRGGEHVARPQIGDMLNCFPQALRLFSWQATPGREIRISQGHRGYGGNLWIDDKQDLQVTHSAFPGIAVSSVQCPLAAKSQEATKTSVMANVRHASMPYTSFHRSHAHVRTVLQNGGQELPPLFGESRNCKGIGGCRATGRRGIRFGLILPSESSVHAELESGELSVGTERIMLLSIKAQTTWGLLKETRADTCFLEDYGQCVPLCEVVESDLRCVCISYWHTD